MTIQGAKWTAEGKAERPPQTCAWPERVGERATTANIQREVMGRRKSRCRHTAGPPRKPWYADKPGDADRQDRISGKVGKKLGSGKIGR